MAIEGSTGRAPQETPAGTEPSPLISCFALGDYQTNCFVVRAEPARPTCWIVDCGYEPEPLLDHVASEGLRPVALLLTHCHSDHTAGNRAIIAATGAKLLIHALDAERLKTLLNNTFSRVLGGKSSPDPDVLLQDNQVITLGASHLKTIHTPGHTPGGICLYTEGHVFTGDTLFVEAVGRTDLPGGSSSQLLRSIKEKIYTLPGSTLVWPGHDYGPTPSSTVADEIRNNPFTY